MNNKAKPASPKGPPLSRWALGPNERVYADPVAAASRDTRSWSWLGSAALLFALLMALGAWAYEANIEEVATGQARVVASQREQVIQSLEGGLLAEMMVREGSVVNKDDPLLRIDPTRAQASFDEGRSKQLALMAQAARLRAESRGAREIRLPADVQAAPELAASEKATFSARQFALSAASSGQKATRQHLQRELDLTEPLVRKGLASEVELHRLRRQLSEIDMQTSERINRFRAEASTDLSRTEAELKQQTDLLAAKRDQMQRTLVRAPLRGIVKNIRANTAGGVIQPGQDILEIVPLDDTLLVEAKIRPSQVAFLKPGLAANVKLSAYDAQIYGSLKGKVEFISPDTLKDERRTEEETYYRVMVRTEQGFLKHRGAELPVIPGMTATVDILTGQRTVADYLLKPVLRLDEAFRER